MRSQTLDVLRWIAIVLMVAFHANFLLVHWFWNTAIDVSHVLWTIIGRSAALTFMFVSGMVFYLSSRNKSLVDIWKSALRRFAILASIAILISLVTYLFANRFFIVFGIIHFFAIASLLIPLFTSLGKKNFVFGIAIAVLGIVFDMVRVESPYLFLLWLRTQAFASGDYYPIFPWFWVILMGYATAVWLVENGKLESIIKPRFASLSHLEFLGKHSLVIYVTHVPVLYLLLKMVGA